MKNANAMRLGLTLFAVIGAVFATTTTAKAATKPAKAPKPVHSTKASTSTTPTVNESGFENEFVLANVPSSKEQVWINGETVYATQSELSTEQYAPLFVTINGVEVENFVPQAVADWYKSFPNELALSDYAKGDYLYETIQNLVPSSTTGVTLGRAVASQQLVGAQFITG